MTKVFFKRRHSNSSLDFLSLCGERNTTNFFFFVGK